MTNQHNTFPYETKNKPNGTAFNENVAVPLKQDSAFSVPAMVGDFPNVTGVNSWSGHSIAQKFVAFVTFTNEAKAHQLAHYPIRVSNSNHHSKYTI
jgi:hypothetical protein